MILSKFSSCRTALSDSGAMSSRELCKLKPANPANKVKSMACLGLVMLPAGRKRSLQARLVNSRLGNCDQQNGAGQGTVTSKTKFERRSRMQTLEWINQLRKMSGDNMVLNDGTPAWTPAGCNYFYRISKQLGLRHCNRLAAHLACVSTGWLLPMVILFPFEMLEIFMLFGVLVRHMQAMGRR